MRDNNGPAAQCMAPLSPHIPPCFPITESLLAVNKGYKLDNEKKEARRVRSTAMIRDKLAASRTSGAKGPRTSTELAVGRGKLG